MDGKGLPKREVGQIWEWSNKAGTTEQYVITKIDEKHGIWIKAVKDSLYTGEFAYNDWDIEPQCWRLAGYSYVENGPPEEEPGPEVIEI